MLKDCDNLTDPIVEGFAEKLYDASRQWDNPGKVFEIRAGAQIKGTGRNVSFSKRDSPLEPAGIDIPTEGIIGYNAKSSVEAFRKHFGLDPDEVVSRIKKKMDMARVEGIEDYRFVMPSSIKNEFDGIAPGLIARIEESGVIIEWIDDF